MKFWQIAAAILIFKVFDGCWAFVASATDDKIPAVTIVGSIFLWVIVSFFIWAAFSGFEKIPARND